MALFAQVLGKIIAAWRSVQQHRHLQKEMGQPSPELEWHQKPLR